MIFVGQSMWPGFRVAKLKRNNGKYALKVDVLEPAYYWRVQRDYDDVPEPTVLHFNPQAHALDDVRDLVLGMGSDAPRIVLQVRACDSLNRTTPAVTAV